MSLARLPDQPHAVSAWVLIFTPWACADQVVITASLPNAPAFIVAREAPTRDLVLVAGTPRDSSSLELLALPDVGDEVITLTHFGFESLPSTVGPGPIRPVTEGVRMSLRERATSMQRLVLDHGVAGSWQELGELPSSLAQLRIARPPPALCEALATAAGESIDLGLEGEGVTLRPWDDDALLIAGAGDSSALGEHDRAFILSANEVIPVSIRARSTRTCADGRMATHAFELRTLTKTPTGVIGLVNWCGGDNGGALEAVSGALEAGLEKFSGPDDDTVWLTTDGAAGAYGLDLNGALRHYAEETTIVETGLGSCDADSGCPGPEGHACCRGMLSFSNGTLIGLFADGRGAFRRNGEGTIERWSLDELAATIVDVPATGLVAITNGGLNVAPTPHVLLDDGRVLVLEAPPLTREALAATIAGGALVYSGTSAYLQLYVPGYGYCEAIDGRIGFGHTRSLVATRRSLYVIGRELPGHELIVRVVRFALP